MPLPKIPNFAFYDNPVCVCATLLHRDLQSPHVVVPSVAAVSLLGPFLVLRQFFLDVSLAIVETCARYSRRVVRSARSVPTWTACHGMRAHNKRRCDWQMQGKKGEHSCVVIILLCQQDCHQARAENQASAARVAATVFAVALLLLLLLVVVVFSDMTTMSVASVGSCWFCILLLFNKALLLLLILLSLFFVCSNAILTCDSFGGINATTNCFSSSFTILVASS